jgi:hypothetical protein
VTLSCSLLMFHLSSLGKVVTTTQLTSLEQIALLAKEIFK